MRYIAAIVRLGLTCVGQIPLIKPYIMLGSPLRRTGLTSFSLSSRVSDKLQAPCVSSPENQASLFAMRGSTLTSRK